MGKMFAGVSSDPTVPYFEIKIISLLTEIDRLFHSKSFSLLR